MKKNPSLFYDLNTNFDESQLKHTKNFFDYIDITNDLLQNKNQEFFDEMQKFINKYIECFKKIKNKSWGIYIHIMECHFVDLIQIHGSLNIYSNQVI